MTRRWLIGMVEANIIDESLPESPVLVASRSLIGVDQCFDRHIGNIFDDECKWYPEAIDDNAMLDDLRAHGDRWDNQRLAIVPSPNLKFYQSKACKNACVSIEVPCNGLQVRTDAVARDDEVEIACEKGPRHALYKAHLVQLRYVSLNFSKERIRTRPS